MQRASQIPLQYRHCIVIIELLIITNMTSITPQGNYRIGHDTKTGINSHEINRSEGTILNQAIIPIT